MLGRLSARYRLTEEYLLPLFGALFFGSTIITGTPVLRHDWPSPYHTLWPTIGSLSGWDPSGIGSPVSYPSSFIVVTATALVSSVCGSRIETIAFICLIGAACASAAQALAKALTPARITQVCSALFLVCNPWAYTELVSGHTLMLLSYAGMMYLAALLIRDEKRPLPYIFALLAIEPQIQFLVLAFPVTIAFLSYKRLIVPLCAWLISPLPIVVGVLLNTSSLLSTPLTVSWESSQSVAPLDALRLTGYFAHYAIAYDGWLSIAGWAMAAIALAGAIRVLWFERRLLPIVAATAGALAIACGTKAPWGPLAGYTFAHIPEAGLFRELYDLVGIAAIGYAALAAIAVRVQTRLAAVWLAADIALLTAWFLLPPGSYWVPAQSIPKLTIRGENSRFALVPAFQPLSYRGRGSGIDPDAYVRAGNMTPLNESFPEYPVNTALSAYIYRGNDRLLRGLGVSVVLERPQFKTDIETLSAQLAISPDKMRAAGASRIYLRSVPELSTLPLPKVGTLDTRIGSGDIFFADAGNARGKYIPARWRSYGEIHPMTPDRSGANAAQDWVDARLAFSARPELGQPFGGALTTNGNRLLRVDPAREILTYVQGSLLTSAGALVTRTTGEYRWLALPPGTSMLRCRGLCVVAAQGDPPDLPEQPAPSRSQAVAFRVPISWISVATLPPGGLRLLRYSTSYNRLWHVFAGNVEFDHVRIDNVLNGWIFPGNRRPMQVIIIEMGALAVACSELVTIAVLGSCILLSVRNGPSRRETIGRR